MAYLQQHALSSSNQGNCSSGILGDPYDIPARTRKRSCLYYLLLLKAVCICRECATKAVYYVAMAMCDNFNVKHGVLLVGLFLLRSQQK